MEKQTRRRRCRRLAGSALLACGVLAGCGGGGDAIEATDGARADPEAESASDTAAPTTTTISGLGDEAPEPDAAVFTVSGVSSDTALELENGQTLTYEAIPCDASQSDAEWSYGLSSDTVFVLIRVELSGGSPEGAPTTIRITEDETVAVMVETVTSEPMGTGWTATGDFSVTDVAAGTTETIRGTFRSSCEGQ